MSIATPLSAIILLLAAGLCQAADSSKAKNA
jgi:hypothetical protein